MINKNKLKGKIVENGMNVTTVAQKIGMNPASLYRRLNGELDFTVTEASTIANMLALTRDELNDIFFAQDVAYHANGEE